MRIGARSNIKNVVLDFHNATGNLFAVILYYDTSATEDRWTVNFSNDMGATWSETYQWTSGGVTMNDIDAAVITDSLYVGYIGDLDQYDARSRRCSAFDGSIDNAYFWKQVFNKGIEIEEVAFTSNADFFDNRIYYLAILADNSLIYYWDDEAGASWGEISTGITNADLSLDAHTNQDFTEYFLVASYISTATDNRLHVARKGTSWIDTDLDSATTSEETSVAAYQDRMLTVFRDNNGDMKYWVSYDEGANWYWGYIAQGMLVLAPHVAGRHGGGFRVIYQQETGEPDSLWTRHRDYGTGPGTASWDDPLYINETADVYTGTPTNVQWIPSAASDYGAAWIAGPTPTTAWFDVVVPVGIGDPSNDQILDQFHLTQNYPNPFNPSTTIRFYVPQKDQITLDIYNNLGQRVRRLVDEVSYLPGSHSVVWDGRTDSGEIASSGIYFYKMESGDFRATRKMLLLK